MSSVIRVAILDDHQSIIDGYCYRLSKDPFIEVVGIANYGEQLEPLLAAHRVDVLLLDVGVALSPLSSNNYPILHIIPRLLQHYPAIHMVVISMHAERALIKAVMEVGASGYVLKDDGKSLKNLVEVVRVVAHGGIYFSPTALTLLQRVHEPDAPLSLRQREALALCAAYPDRSTAELALHMHVAHSTMRNTLSDAYVRLKVNNRTSAITEALRRGWIMLETPWAENTPLGWVAPDEAPMPSPSDESQPKPDA